MNTPWDYTPDENGHIPSYTPVSVNTDYHATWSMELGELVAAGFDPFGDEAWNTLEWYDGETRERFEKKFMLRYKHYEIGETPALRWRDDLTARMAETTRKYLPWYKWLANGGDPLTDGNEWGKDRNVYSDYPATLLNTQMNDYATNGTDRQWEHVHTGDMLDTLQKLRASRDIDQLMLDECATLFSWTDGPQTMIGG